MSRNRRIVDLSAIEHNMRLIRNAVPQPVRVLAVVKADGYGHGAVETARAAIAGGADMLAVKTLMYAHFALVLFVTLMPVLVALPFFGETPYIPMNSHPFIDVRLRRGDYMRQIALNTLLLMPYGFLRPLTKKGYCLFGTVIMTFFISLTIELLQPFTARTSDITDIITNTAGGAAGCMLSACLRPVTGAILKAIAADVLHTVADSGSKQGLAGIEGSAAKFGDAIGYTDVLQLGTA